VGGSHAPSDGVIAGSGGGCSLLKRIKKRIAKHPKEASRAPLLDHRGEISLTYFFPSFFIIFFFFLRNWYCVSAAAVLEFFLIAFISSIYVTRSGLMEPEMEMQPTSCYRCHRCRGCMIAFSVVDCAIKKTFFIAGSFLYSTVH